MLMVRLFFNKKKIIMKLNNISYSIGWYEIENDGTKKYRWSQPNSQLLIPDQKCSHINLFIGCDRDKTIDVKYNDGTKFTINIKKGWFIYKILYSPVINFMSDKLQIDDVNETRNLSFMLSDISLVEENQLMESTKFSIKNIKSNWFDLVYELYETKHAYIEIETLTQTKKYPVFTGGERSISFKISENDIIDNEFIYKIKINKNINILIKSIINREHFYDFLGLEKNATPETLKNKNNTIKISQTARMTLQWFVTWKCNMSCNYCWQESAGNIYRNISGKQIKKPEEWASKFNSLNPAQLYFTGGEPSLYKELPELINLLNPNIQLMMTSNFGKTFDIDKWKNIDTSRWGSIFFSFHPTQWKNPDEFFIKLNSFMKYFDPNKIGIEMVLHPDNINLVDPNKIINYSTKYNLLTPHLDEFVYSGINKLNFKFKNNITDMFYNENINNSYKFTNETKEKNRQPVYCPAGWKRINIDFEGNIFTCMSAIDRSKLFDSSAMPHYSPIANIFDENFKLREEPILCWESFRCSACDYQSIQQAWTPYKKDFNYQLPIPE